MLLKIFSYHSITFCLSKIVDILIFRYDLINLRFLPFSHVHICSPRNKRWKSILKQDVNRFNCASKILVSEYCLYLINNVILLFIIFSFGITLKINLKRSIAWRTFETVKILLLFKPARVEVRIMISKIALTKLLLLYTPSNSNLGYCQRLQLVWTKITSNRGKMKLRPLRT